jgi:HPt (histidine-containing phosphotransfer) domain-containing protein
VAKPVDPSVLYKTVLRWLPLRKLESAQARPGPQMLDANALANAPLTDRLRLIEGLDVDLALRSVAGQAPLLKRTLRRFVDTYRDGLPQLLDATGDQREVASRRRAVCHSMRGGLGTIGATRLLQQVTRLEQHLGENAEPARIDAEARDFHESLMVLVGRLDAELAA